LTSDDQRTLASVAVVDVLPGQPFDLVTFPDDRGRTPLDDDRVERHASRTDLTRAQWNAKMNRPCRLTPTMNNTCSVQDAQTTSPITGQRDRERE